MEITQVEVRKIQTNDPRMVGIANVCIDGSFKIRDIRIIRNPEKTFIAMPSRKLPNGEYRDYAHPVNQEVRDMFEKAILDKFNELP